jgi:hypothetical protein
VAFSRICSANRLASTASLEPVTPFIRNPAHILANLCGGAKLGLSKVKDQVSNLTWVLRRIFGPKRDEDGPWRKLHSDELHNLYSSPNIVRVIKSR